MIKNKTVLIKLIVLSAVIGLISCETDLNNVGSNLVNNNTFETDKEVVEVIAYNQNVERSRVDNLSVTNLGVLNHDDFGILKAGFVTQVGLPVLDVDFGDTPTIDDVILEIPYDYTVDTDLDDGRPQYTLNNILGSEDVSYNLKISELGTYLNSLDEEDPTESKKYYSDNTYTSLTQLYNDQFKPNANDTVAYVRRIEFDEIVDGVLVEDKDTIKNLITGTSKAYPSLKIKLDKDFFQTKFLNADSQYFDDINLLKQYFKGLYFEVIGDDGSLIQLDLTSANINIYYTSGIETDETDEDLNGDGDTDDEDVLVRTKRSIQFPISGIKNNFYNRDYTSTTTINNLLNNPNTTQGEDRLYLQGCAGSNAVIDIFDGLDIEGLRNRDILINDANLVVHIDKDISTDNDFIPSRLFLYKLDPNLTNDIDENTQILDLFTEGEASFDGNVVTESFTNEDDEIDYDKLSYKFNITDYISEVLNSEDPLEPSEFVLKTYHSTDLPTTTIDTIVRNFSWSPKGVVVYGSNIPSTDANYSKRLKLEISFSELNN